MKLCIPIKKDDGFESIVFSHFGSAPAFLLYDTEKEDMRIVSNSNQHDKHGTCHPIRALGSEKVDVVIVGGIGRRAISKFSQQPPTRSGRLAGAILQAPS
ncbi:MAG: hypothetical protein B6242_02545 [Anaerolineaceae bacterium 4572_78]|nr:MAG: hypothetical protein B6242_02545 [Anaerolineaceae bacterium 4572_78]